MVTGDRAVAGCSQRRARSGIHILVHQFFSQRALPQVSSLPHIPAVGQVEGYAALDASSKLQVPQTPQADVEGSDDGHPCVQDDWKLPGVLHFVFKGQNL